MIALKPANTDRYDGNVIPVRRRAGKPLMFRVCEQVGRFVVGFDEYYRSICIIDLDTEAKRGKYRTFELATNMAYPSVADAATAAAAMPRGGA